MTATLAERRIGALRRLIARRLAHGFDAAGRDGTPALDARMIVALALGVDDRALVFADDQAVSAEVEARVMALAERRLSGEPIARIRGEKEFWGLTFRLSPETLVPRPDTETVVSAALAAIDRDRARAAPLAILDIGTGSGAILVALLAELPRARGVGTDRAFGALATARENAIRLGVADRAAFVLGDWATALRGGFDLVVSNPPYVATDEIDRLPVEVGRHDPHLALDGGRDGAEGLRSVLSDLRRLLRPAGHAFVEVGRGQAQLAMDFAGGLEFDAKVHADLSGIDRVVEICDAHTAKTNG